MLLSENLKAGFLLVTSLVHIPVYHNYQTKFIYQFASHHQPLTPPSTSSAASQISRPHYSPSIHFLPFPRNLLLSALLSYPQAKLTAKPVLLARYLPLPAEIYESWFPCNCNIYRIVVKDYSVVRFIPALIFHKSLLHRTHTILRLR